MIIAEIEISSSAAKIKQCNAVQLNTELPSMYLRQNAVGKSDDNLLPVGACGLKVKFTFLDSAWGTLSKTAVFRNKSTTMDAAIIDGCATIPHEVLSKVLDVVEVGVYGTNSAKNVAIPTLWMQLGTVASAANPTGKSSAAPTLPYWAQIKEQLDTVQNQMMDQEDLQVALAQAKESGNFDGPQGVQGEKGDKGDTGASGYSPEKGVDYWTQAEQTAIVTEAANIASKAVNTSSDIVCEAEGNTVVLADSADRELHGLKLYGKTTQNGIPAPEAPVPLESVGADGSIDVTISGRQLFNYATCENKGGTYPSYYNTNKRLLSDFIPVSAGRYTITYPTEIMFCQCHEYTKDKVYLTSGIFDTTEGKVSFTIANSGYVQLLFRCPPDADISPSDLSTAMFNVGDTALPFEPYKEIQTLIAQTPHGLPGIPVTSGGNYTDENGQMWICDEIDFARGKYVQRLGDIASYSSEPISGQYMSTTGALTTGAMILYALNAPIETDLTAEELAQYSALHTNYPNTTIYNEGADMAVKYVADTKLYIDNKFAELATAILNA